MSNNTKIEWCDATINPFVGCSKISVGCENCYAEKIAMRMVHNPKVAHMYEGTADQDGWTGAIKLRLGQLYNVKPWSKRKRVFIGSMTDFFHENIPDNAIRHSLATLYVYPQHTFMLLTKRPSRMKSVIQREADFAQSIGKGFPNLWLGVTVCNQQEADEKIPILLATPAAKRFVSVEPMLGEIDLTDLRYDSVGFDVLNGKHGVYLPYSGESNRLDWVICGGETGQKARPMDIKWARSLRDQCVNAGVPFFFKSTGGKDKTDLLDGVEWKQFPVVK